MPVKKINVVILALTFSLSIIFINFTFESNSEVDKTEFSSFLLGNKEALAQQLSWTNYTTDNGVDWKLNTNVPPDWQITEDEKNESGLTTNTVVLISPKENPNDLFQENIVLSIKSFTDNIGSNETLNTQDIIEKLQSQYTMFKFNNISKTKIDNLRNLGDSIVYEFKDSGLLFKTKQVFLTEGKTIYIFSLLAEQKEYSKYSLIFDQVLKSIHFSN
ncbi:MAG TPA: hypothetical protein VFG45_01185 [Candidatus Nitrosocosmicus sp.]|jgi:hypothetical protein|uniref:hypothetical protein n=1 Tax=Candidatus Nitrosocosmicus agrestis TaxID=2563600 RepID=UPI00122E5910|nr:hypothetical protein [Candidatus Nitrosocosmicus sp. SS]KAA2282400.1 hypothetical protein F1Z66_05790 [Candidatus Nitrosocosmicus sp. SS]KAF0868006.1 hypothetical protein E5N71_12555 [Candidatus Nitrosocosmicus sp. SS]HET6588758.1 hypothetical protein [Candidatus Nitrosocosmicus sp.]